MLRRAIIRGLLITPAALCAVLRAQSPANAAVTIRGKLQPGDKPALTVDSKQAELMGDASTMKVLADDRLKGADLELAGQWQPDGKFRIDPFHTHAVHVYKDGKRLQISYWCSVCSIRTYTPGKCMCCQDETELDLKEKFD